MHYISDILYWISTGLMVPVVFLLIVLFMRALWLILGFFGQYLQVRKSESILKNQFELLDGNHVDALAAHLTQVQGLTVTPYLQRMLQYRNNAAQLQRVSSEFEVAADKQLATCKTLTKLGPMLGLMGTLIPMGPALVGLAQGDISSMAYNMQVAFATTVVGLFCSAIGFFVCQIKERWFFQDMSYLQCLQDTLTTVNKENSHA